MTYTNRFVYSVQFLSHLKYIVYFIYYSIFYLVYYQVGGQAKQMSDSLILRCFITTASLNNYSDLGGRRIVLEWGDDQTTGQFGHLQRRTKMLETSVLSHFCHSAIFFFLVNLWYHRVWFFLRTFSNTNSSGHSHFWQLYKTLNSALTCTSCGWNLKAAST